MARQRKDDDDKGLVIIRSDITEELRRRCAPSSYMSLNDIAAYRGCCLNAAKTLMAGAHCFQFTPGSQKKSFHITVVADRIARCSSIA